MSFASNKGLVAAASLIFALPACTVFSNPQAPVETPRPEGVISIGLPPVGNLDPAQATKLPALTVLRAACDGLTGLDEEGRARAALAQEWTVDPGGRRLELRIRDSVVFNDGTDVDAQSVVESLSRLVRRTTESPWQHLLRDVAGYAEVRSGEESNLSGIRAVDTRTLEIEFVTPFADFPSLLAHPAMMPVSAKEPPPGIEPAGPACAGPYQFEFGTAEGELRLVASRSYKSTNLAFAGDGGSIATTIVVREYETAADAYQAFQSGEVDSALVPDAQVSDAVRGGEGFARADTLEVTYIGMDTTLSITNNRRIRQALSLALDRLLLIDGAFGDRRQPAVRWLRSLPGEAAPAACDSYMLDTASDPSRAKSLITSTGAKGTDINLPLYFDTSNFSQLVAQAIQVQMKDALGASIDLRPLTSSAFAASIKDRAAPGLWLLTSIAEVPVPSLSLAALLETSGVDNRLGFTNVEFDGLVRQAQASTDPTSARDLYRKAEDTACELMPAIPLWRGVRHWAFNPAKIEFKGEAAVGVFGGLILRHASPTS